MYIIGPKVYNGQHQNVSGHHPLFLTKTWDGAKDLKRKKIKIKIVLPAIRTLLIGPWDYCI
jgi:hypothetical protein